MLASWLKSAALGALLALSPLATAGDSGAGVPAPVIQKGTGDKCVADTEYMRRNHMKDLKHQRDQTMHQGIRTKQFSLKNCIECHATPDASGSTVVRIDKGGPSIASVTITAPATTAEVTGPWPFAAGDRLFARIDSIGGAPVGKGCVVNLTGVC